MAVLGRDKVLVAVRTQVNLYQANPTVELTCLRRIVRTHVRARIMTDIAGLITREGHGNGRIDATRTSLLTIIVKDHIATLTQAATVVLELHAHLMLARRDRTR